MPAPAQRSFVADQRPQGADLDAQRSTEPRPADPRGEAPLPAPAPPVAPLDAVLVPGAPGRGRPHPRNVTLDILSAHPRPLGQVRYLNRELSWVQFNERVLALAEDPDLELLERAKFLAIFQTNLDEFFQVRVAGLKEQEAAEVTGTNPDGMSPTSQLDALHDVVTELATRHARIFREQLVPELTAAGIRFCDVADLDEGDRQHLQAIFEERVLPVLTPLAVDPAHPFPYISNLSMNLAVLVGEPGSEHRRFARVKVPPVLPRFLIMPDGQRIVPLEQVIAENLDRLFTGLQVLDHHVFRVTRNADFEVEEEEADDLLLAIETELTRRRFGRVVRLEVTPDMSEETLDLLIRELNITTEDVMVIPGPLDLAGLWSLYGLDRPDLKQEPFAPTTQPLLAEAGTSDIDIFEAIAYADVLVQHPYDSFTTSVQAFIEQAARDPDVLAIKQTLYRTSGPGSPVIKALLDAADAGKQVVALVELKARFDEEANIEWAKALEEAGVHVAYGVVGLKTHTKISLVVRRESGRIRRYAHIGTGNYNDKTARIYEDIGLLTADPDIGQDLSDLFNVLTGYSKQSEYRKMVVAPTTFRSRMLELIARERDAEDGHIVAKMNSLVDGQIIEALYDAASTGTPIELIVRGICCLRPGVPGLSESITVRSIVGRYLEHSRIYRFGSETRGYDHLIGSGDWMTRNLSRRVEALTPVEDPRLQRRLEEILTINLADDLLSWELGPDGRWRRVPTTRGVDTHLTLQERARRRAEA